MEQQIMTDITIIQGDIVTAEVDAIVCATSRSLRGNSGVARAIHHAVGPAIEAECAEIREQEGGCPPGSAVITTAGDLNADYVIHTVGPVWNRGRSGEPIVLARCYHACLELAVEYGIQSIAFPSIATGYYKYPIADAAATALNAVREFVLQNPEALETIQFILYDDVGYAAYQDALDAMP